MYIVGGRRARRWSSVLVACGSERARHGAPGCGAGEPAPRPAGPPAGGPPAARPADVRPAVPVPPLDRPHYHGVGLAADADQPRRARPLPWLDRGRRATARRSPVPDFLTPSRASASPSHDVQEGGHRGVPEEKRPTAPRFHGRHQLNRAPGRAGEVRRLRAVRLGLPGRRDLRRGRATTPRTERFSPGERYGRVYQINYLRCIFCGLCIEACPTRALTMTNEYELADDNRQSLIFTKEQLLAPLLPGHGAAAAPDAARRRRAGLLPGQVARRRTGRGPRSARRRSPSRRGRRACSEPSRDRAGGRSRGARPGTGERDASSGSSRSCRVAAASAWSSPGSAVHCVAVRWS